MRKIKYFYLISINHLTINPLGNNKKQQPQQQHNDVVTRKATTTSAAEAASKAVQSFEVKNIQTFLKHSLCLADVYLSHGNDVAAVFVLFDIFWGWLFKVDFLRPTRFLNIRLTKSGRGYLG